MGSAEATCAHAPMGNLDVLHRIAADMADPLHISEFDAEQNRDRTCAVTEHGCIPDARERRAAGPAIDSHLAHLAEDICAEIETDQSAA